MRLGRVMALDLAMVGAADLAEAETLAVTIANATVVDVIEADPRGATGGLSISLSRESAEAYGAFSAENLGKTVELRQNGARLVTFVIAETVTHGRIRLLGIEPERALAIARQINHTVIELVETVAP